MTTEETFDQLVQDFISRAGRVKCSQEEYVDGLRAAVGEVQTAIQAAVETMGDGE